MQPLSGVQAARASHAFGLLGRGDADAALRIARELAAAAPAAPDAQHLLALCLAQTGAVPAAEQAFRRALQLAPRQPAILNNLVILLRGAGRLAEALDCLQQLTRLLPRQGEAWLDLGLVALDLQTYPVALSALQHAVQLLPQSVRAWHALGNVHTATDDLEAAEQCFRQALQLGPDQVPVWLNLAGLLRLRGRPLEALDCLQQVRQLGYPGPEALESQTGALLDAGRVAEAMQLSGQLTREHPQHVSGHVTRAHLLWEYGRTPTQDLDPLAEFRAAAQQQATNIPLQLAWISFLLDARRCEEALQRVEELRRSVDHPVLLALQANTLELLDRPQQSAPLYAQAHAALGNTDTAFLNAYVRHLLKAGQWDLAAQRAEEALAVDPDNQEAWAYLATAWRLLGDPREEWLCGYDRLIELLEVEVPAGYADRSDFLVALQRSLDLLHQSHSEPVRQSLRGGSQTPGRLFGRSDPSIVAAEQVLRRAVQSWVARLPVDPRHPFLRRAAPAIRFTGSWSVKLRSAGKHVNHYHSDGWMSSAFYVALPASVRQAEAGSTAGHIQFGQPPLELGLDLPPRRVIQPRAGCLALFPSYMWHGTVPFFDDEARVSVAFDMLPRP